MKRVRSVLIEAKVFLYFLTRTRYFSHHTSLERIKTDVRAIHLPLPHLGPTGNRGFLQARRLDLYNQGVTVGLFPMMPGKTSLLLCPLRKWMLYVLMSCVHVLAPRRYGAAASCWTNVDVELRTESQVPNATRVQAQRIVPCMFIPVQLVLNKKGLKSTVGAPLDPEVEKKIG